MLKVTLVLRVSSQTRSRCKGKHIIILKVADWNFNVFGNSCAFYVKWVWWKLLQKDLRTIETCRSLSGLYVKMNVLILVHLLVLPVRAHGIFVTSNCPICPPACISPADCREMWYWDIVKYFEKIRIWLKSGKISVNLHEDLSTF
jgi:hypothetical protein